MASDGAEANPGTAPRNDPHPVDVRDIEDALTQLWMTSHTGGRSGMQAYVLNLMILAGSASDIGAIQSVAARVGATHPSRTLIVQTVESGDTAMRAWISAQCEYPAANDHAGSEQITLEAAGDGFRLVPGTVIPLLIPDVPVAFWCPDDTMLHHPLFTPLMDATDQLVVDTSAFADSINGLSSLHVLATEEYPGVAFRDLAWARLTPWRELTAQFFDAPTVRPYLDGIHRVHVAYAHGDSKQFNPEQALLYASWLASRLDWEAIPNLRRFGREAMLIARSGEAPITMEFSARHATDLPSGSLLAATLTTQVEDSTAVFRIERAADRAHTVVTTEIQGEPPRERIVPMEEPSVADTLADEVSTVRRDHVYEEALAVAIRLASSRSGGAR